MYCGHKYNKITNYEKIKSMTIDEMADWLDKILNQDRDDWNEPGCYHCAYYGTHHQPKDCGDCEYKEGLKGWLNREIN